MPPIGSTLAETHPVDSCRDSGDDYLRGRSHARGEWWYYNGHLLTAGRELSFHVAFFRFVTSGFVIGKWVPLSLFTPQVGFAHASLTCHQQRTTWFSQRRNLLWRSRPNGTSLDVRLGDWTAQGDATGQRLRVAMGSCQLCLDLQPNKPLVSYDRLFPVDRAASHCSYPRMSVSGQIAIAGDQHPVDGLAWMDREYGEIGPDEKVAGWVWMSVQLSDGQELMVYRMVRHDRPTPTIRCALVDRLGQVRGVAPRQLRMTPTMMWSSRTTEAEYPVAWTIEIPDERIKLDVEALFQEVEFDTRGTTNTVYWEGPASVRGQHSGRTVEGKAFIEMVGRERKKLLGQIDQPRKYISTLGYLRNELRFRFFGDANHQRQHPGRT